MKAMSLAVKPDGTISAIYDDALADLCQQGHAHITRASHVEPTPNGEWTADCSPGGPVLGPYPLRQQALDAEIEYLESTLF